MPNIYSALETLKVEIQALEEQLPCLRKQFPVGTYVLFAGSCLPGGFRSYAKALEAGFEHAGEGSFLVKQVSKEGEDVAHMYGLQA